MYLSKHIYFADYYSALLLAIAATVVFARTVLQQNYRAWRKVPSKLWWFSVCSWITGVVIIFFTEYITHWVAVVPALASLIIIARAIVRAAQFWKEVVPEESRSPTAVKATIGLYFCVSASSSSAPFSPDPK